MDFDRDIGIRMDEAGFSFLSKGVGKRDSDESYTKVIFFRELETLECIFVTVVELRFCEGWSEVALSRFKKLVGSLGLENDNRIVRQFKNEDKPTVEVLEEAIEFADLIASYDATP